MRILASAALVATALAGGATAATFAGYESTGTVLYSGAAFVSTDPTGFGQTASFDGLAQVDLNLTVNAASLVIFAPFTVSDAFLGYMLSEDPVGDDEIAFLFSLEPGSATHAIATYTGDLDSGGSGGFFATGAFDFTGTLTIDAARTTPTNPIPLPAGLPMLAAGLGALVIVRRRRVGRQGRGA